MWVYRRDIDPGELAKVPKERTFFNVAKTNGPRYRSTHVYDSVGGKRTCDRSCSKAHFAETGLPRRFLRDVLASLSTCGTSIAAASRSPLERASSPRCPLSELLYAAFGVNVHLLLLRSSLSKRPTGNMSEIWLSSSVCAIRGNKRVTSIRSCCANIL